MRQPKNTISLFFFIYQIKFIANIFLMHICHIFGTNLVKKTQFWALLNASIFNLPQNSYNWDIQQNPKLRATFMMVL